ncbi:MAG: ABC transporter ATP-binding protein [Candidatus Cloacimonadota bacterium]|nr:ABC transporter ATP-binding protein [Candidatus Cloacimonadota bacterium]
MLELNNISFRYNVNSPLLINNFSFFAKKRDIIAVRGDSGTGKTTLLNIICSVTPKIFPGDLSGTISHNNIDISELSLPEVAPQISLLMQHPDNQLFFPTVEQELAFAPENLKVPANDIIRRIDNVLAKLDIEDLRHKETASLSFGQKKLVTLASIITLSPEVYLLDEPFAGLSKEYIKIISNEIRAQADNGKIIFLAGHTNDIAQLANKTIEMEELNEVH